jgi:hypothetical protein
VNVDQALFLAKESLERRAALGSSMSDSYRLAAEVLDDLRGRGRLSLLENFELELLVLNQPSGSALRLSAADELSRRRRERCGYQGPGRYRHANGPVYVVRGRVKFKGEWLIILEREEELTLFYELASDFDQPGRYVRIEEEG